MTWHFYISPVTGLGGPSAALYDILVYSGVKVVIR
jgi:hypothetical protein